MAWVDQTLLRPFPGESRKDELAVVETITANALNGERRRRGSIAATSGKLAATGLAGGAVVSFGVTRLVSSMLVKVNAADPAIFAARLSFPAQWLSLPVGCRPAARR